MKIIINEMESYEISLPATIKLADFAPTLERLERLHKFLGRDALSSASTDFNPATPNVNLGKKYKKWNREDFVRLMKVYYSPLPREERIKILAKDGVEYKTFSAKAWSYRKRYDIKPEEIGLRKFPNVSEVNDFAALRLPETPQEQGEKKDGTV